MTRPNEPVLAPPGAGLPAVELFIGRLLFRGKCAFGSSEAFRSTFVLERKRIRVMVLSNSKEIASQRVLIPRIRGLEDSSRHWSVWMTLDHLRIVNNAMAAVITALGRGTVPAGKASTAAVKPSLDVDDSVVAAYEASCDALMAAVDRVADLKNTPRFPHPWFGPLNAFEWVALSAGHLRIHRVQIEQILARVPRS